MAEKSFTPIEVRLDEVNLSLLGFDISDAQARLVVDYDKWDKRYEYEIHWSIRGRFDAEEWRDRYVGYRSPQLTSFINVPEFSNERMTYYMGRLDGETVLKISNRRDLGATKRKIDPDTVTAYLTAFDYQAVVYEITPIGKKTRKVPIELIAEPAGCGCTPKVLELHCNIGSESGADEPFLQMFITGTIELCPMVKDRQTFARARRTSSDQYRHFESHRLPKLGIELLDQTGFILEEDSEAVEMEAQIDRAEGPMRQPRWIFTHRWNLERFSAPPARVIARFHGGERN